MAPRPSWKGFIRLSLVSVPIRAYTATATGAEVRLNQLHEECKSRVQYKKTCPIHGEIKKDEIVSGYEFAKGQYVVVDPSELSKLRTESDRSLAIDGFVPAGTIDPLYQTGRTYFMVPDGPVGQKPYALLVEAMHEEELHAVARAIIAGKEQVVLIRPIDGVLGMTVLEYKSKVKEASIFKDEIAEQKISKEEMKLTKTLIEASRLQDFDFGEYTDEYTAKLTQLIESKVEGKEIVAPPDQEEPKVINLMEALKASVASARKKPAGKSTKKMAPSARGERAPAASARKKKSG